MSSLNRLPLKPFYTEEQHQKTTLYLLPCQSGKTFRMITYMKSVFDDSVRDIDGMRFIHVVFCENSIIQGKQISERLNNEMCKFPDLDDAARQAFPFDHILHTHEQKNTVDKITMEILGGKMGSIVTLKNPYHMSYGRQNNQGVREPCDIYQVMQRIQRIEANYGDDLKTQFVIWIDEADKGFNLTEEFYKLTETLENVCEINLMTASNAQDIAFRFGGNVNTKSYKNTINRNIYHTFRESYFDYTSTKYKMSVTEEIKAIYEKHTPRRGDVWFCPGKHTVSTHDEVCRVSLDYGMAVFVFNYLGNYLWLPGRERQIRVFSNGAIENSLYDVCARYGILDFPICITGYNNIGRGITINSNKISITHAVFLRGVERRPAVAYQLAGRICGNRKHFDSYCIPTVFCSKVFQNVVKGQEYIALEASRRVEDSGNGRGALTTMMCSDLFDESYAEKRKNPEGYPKAATDENKALKKRRTISKDDLFFEQRKLEDVDTKAKFNRFRQEIRAKYGIKFGPLFDTYFAVPNLKNGLYMSHTHTSGNEKRLVQYNESCVWKGGGISMGKNNSFRGIVCYKDIQDPRTGYLVFKFLKSAVPEEYRHRIPEQT